MKIDRARFFVLTGAMSGAIAAAASGACTVVTTSTPDAGTEGGDSGVAQDGSSSDGPGNADVETRDATAETGDSAAACDDTIGTTSACADYVDGGSGPTDGDAGNGCLDALVCDGLLAALKPRVAERAIDCIVALPTCEGTTTNPLAACVASALKAACPDSTAKAACDEIAATCGDAGSDAGTSAADCENLTAGMTADGRTTFVSCMTESACIIADPNDCLTF